MRRQRRVLELDAGSRQRFEAEAQRRARVRAAVEEAVGSARVDKVGVDPAFIDLMVLLTDDVLSDRRRKAEVLARIAARDRAKSSSVVLFAFNGTAYDETVTARPTMKVRTAKQTVYREKVANVGLVLALEPSR